MEMFRWVGVFYRYWVGVGGEGVRGIEIVIEVMGVEVGEGNIG